MLAAHSTYLGHDTQRLSLRLARRTNWSRAAYSAPAPASSSTNSTISNVRPCQIDHHNGGGRWYSGRPPTTWRPGNQYSRSKARSEEHTSELQALLRNSYSA